MTVQTSVDYKIIANITMKNLSVQNIEVPLSFQKILVFEQELNVYVTTYIFTKLSQF